MCFRSKDHITRALEHGVIKESLYKVLKNMREFEDMVEKLIDKEKKKQAWKFCV